MANKKFYSDVEIKADIILDNATQNTVPVVNASNKIVSSAVTSTELGRLSGVTSNIQTQISAALLAATNAQSAVDQEVIDRAAADALLIPLSQKGANNGVATLDAGGKVPVAQLPNAVMTYEGIYNASTNSPALIDGTGNAGMVYRIGTAGSHDFGSGAISFSLGDYVIYSGTVWEKSDGSDAVNSVNSQQGIVVLKANHINRQDDSETIEASLAGLASSIANHLSDTVDAHDASAISNIPSGNLASTDIQSAVNELQSDIDTRALASDLAAHLNDTVDAHDASAISYNNATSSLAATQVQAAIDELKTLVGSGGSGGISETSFSSANNQAAPANVTGLAFNSASVRSFDCVLSVEIDGTSDLYEAFKLYGQRRGSDWVMSVESVGDTSGISFTITSGGQVQYTSSNVAGFVSGSLKFRATVLSV